MKTPKPPLALALAGAALVSAAGLAQAAPPVVSNTSAQQRAGSHLVDITYDVTDADRDALTIAVAISNDGGLTFSVPAPSLTAGPTGGYPTVAGSAVGVHVIWDAGADLANQVSARTVVRITADDGSGTPQETPATMALIPAGVFRMGLEESAVDEVPLHNIFVSSFLMEKLEVHKSLWDEVRSFALANGYSFNHTGAAEGDDHPVHTLNWFDAVKWCNARSEMDGLTPAYYTDASQETVYRGGELDLTASAVRWDASGYRLPTEAEWEKAGRGGLEGKRFAWGDTATGADANFGASGDPFEAAEIKTTPVGYFDGNQTPAGPDRANGYGLYDVAGNVWEWCWDHYWIDYYQQPSATNDDTFGPQKDDRAPALTDRVVKSGSWQFGSNDSRVSVRWDPKPTANGTSFGFRCARSLPDQSRLFTIDTNPIVASAPFVITQVAIDPAGVSITWGSTSGLRYDIESSPSLESASWTKVNADPIDAAGESTSTITPLDGAAAYFRVRVAE